MTLHRSVRACAFAGAILLSSCRGESAEDTAAQQKEHRLAYEMRDVAKQARDATISAVGVYEAADGKPVKGREGNRFGTVTVGVHRTSRPTILVLTSYEPVRWVVEAEPGADVAAVLVGGYYPQEVVGVSDWYVHDLGREYAHKRDVGGYHSLDDSVRRWTGKPIEDFQGKYAGSLFSVGNAGN